MVAVQTGQPRARAAGDDRVGATADAGAVALGLGLVAPTGDVPIGHFRRFIST